MKKRLPLILLSLLLCSVFILSSCGAGDFAYDAESPRADDDYTADVEYSKSAATGSEGIVIPANRKVIYTIDMSVTVASLTDAMRQLSTLVNDYGGWTEYSREREGYASLTFRVPVAKMNDFMGTVSALGEVEDKYVSTKDITSSYADVQNKIDLYQKEYDAYAALYETLLTEAPTPENTQNKLAVLKAMQEALSMIEEYKGTLNGFDKLVDYCTFEIYLYEENVYVEPSYWVELGEVFSGSIGSMGSVFGFMLKAIVAIIPYAVIIGAAVTVVLLICKAASKKKKAKKADKQEEKPLE